MIQFNSHYLNNYIEIYVVRILRIFLVSIIIKLWNCNAYTNLISDICFISDCSTQLIRINALSLYKNKRTILILLNIFASRIPI